MRIMTFFDAACRLGARAKENVNVVVLDPAQLQKCNVKLSWEKVVGEQTLFPNAMAVMPLDKTPKGSIDHASPITKILGLALQFLSLNYVQMDIAKRA